MDRSSGSGVFARDPDAILDLIELPVTEDRYVYKENEVICELYNQAIKHYVPSYDRVGPDDRFSKKQMEHHLMSAINTLPNSQETLKYVDEQKQKAIQSVRQATAWRLEGTLREFPKFKPVNAWFRYPIHVLDETLQDIKLEDDSPKEKWKKSVQKSNQNRSEKTQQELEEAFNVLSVDGNGVDISSIADYLEIAKKTVYNRAGKNKKFFITDGKLFKS
ncbi:hypothetical protein A8C35_10520 [Ligilactobacillus salivarius]|nr:hypothetical protein A8C35_10520 [Ligilactobacillus salivarius]